MQKVNERNFLERGLSLFAPVRGGEGKTVLLMAVNIFILLTAYYIIKPVREALILSEMGAEAKIYASAGQALLLLAVVPLYSWLAGKMPRERLINLVLGFFAACLALFYGLAWTGAPLGLPFYLWVGIFNLMVVAQFWSFANDIYNEEQGKRLFAIIGFGMSAGAVFGSFITGRLIEPLGVYQLMLVSGGLLLVSLVLTKVIKNNQQEPDSQSEAEPDEEPQASSDDPETMVGPSGFTLVFRNRFLLMIAVMMVLANLVNTTGEYILSSRIKDAKEASVPAIIQADYSTQASYEEAVNDRRSEVGKSIGGFYADFFSVVNLVGLLTQLFLVSRIVGLIGVRWAIMILPLIAMSSYGLMAMIPAIGITRWAKTAENSTDYSLQNTVRNMLFLPTTLQEKYKAKQAIDTFFVRGGDVAAALLVLLGISYLNLTTNGFALINCLIAALWALLAYFIGKKYVSLSKKSS